MNNIILKAFELAGFKNASDLAQIVSLTPNPQASAELILGVYRPMSADEFGLYWGSGYRWDKEVYYVHSVDSLSCKATLYKVQPELVCIYYNNAEDAKNKVNGRFDDKNGGYNQTVQAGKLEIKKVVMTFTQLKEQLKPLTYEEYSERYNKLLENEIPEYLRESALEEYAVLENNMDF